MAPATERRNPASLVLAVLVHVAIGGIVWGLCLSMPPATPPPDDPPSIVEFPHVQRPAPPRGGGGGPRTRGPKVPQPPPVVAPPPQVPPPAIDPVVEPPPSVAGPDDPDAESATPGSGPGEPGDPDGVPGGDPSGGPGGGPAGSASRGSGVPEPSSTEPMIIHGDMVMPRLVERIEPDYPAPCRRALIKGTVVLRTIIGPDGSVRVREVLKSVPCLDEAATSAVERWRYEPALWNGRPQAVYLTVRVTFR